MLTDQKHSYIYKDQEDSKTKLVDLATDDINEEKDKRQASRECGV